MILYKYLQPVRLDVLRHRRIRFTQPGDFNDPFEFRPQIEAATDDVRAYVEDNFEVLVDQLLERFHALTPILTDANVRNLLLSLKPMLPEVFRMVQTEELQLVAPAIDKLLSLNVGVLCLSEVRDSILMWGHYTDSHRGVVVGFDSTNPFFSKRGNDLDDFGFLRQVNYQLDRPQVKLTDTTSLAWFQTKSADWAYEKEWRIVRPLSEADRVDMNPSPVCLFEFAPDAVREIVVGMRAAPSLIQEIRDIAGTFPWAAVLKAREDPHRYGLLIEEFD